MKLKKILQRLLALAALMVLVFCFVYRDLVSYGWMQLQGQLEVIREAMPLEEFVEFDSTTAEEKEKIKIILEAKDFAFNELGINYSENYSTIFDQKGKPSMYVVTACEPFTFQPRLWSFPFFGSFPYKGFFVREKAVEELQRVRDEEKLDVGLRTAGGWSTLGWFKDPVLSNMLNRSEGDLASLIIHELTHGTLFVKDSVTFNENLANFIGDKGAELFLSKKYGSNSKELADYIAQRVDEQLFRDYMLRAARSLDSLYGSFQEETDTMKLDLKLKQIQMIKANFDTVSFKSSRYKGYLDGFTPNNTFFMSMLRYNSKQTQLDAVLQKDFDGDLKKYLGHLKEVYPSL